MFNTAVRTLLPVLGAHLPAPISLPTTGCFPRTTDGFKTHNSLSPFTPFSKIIFQWVFPKSWANSSSCILPWPGNGCPHPLQDHSIFAKQMNTFLYAQELCVSSYKSESPGHCLLPQTNSPRSFFFDFNLFATHSLFLFAAGLCYP